MSEVPVVVSVFFVLFFCEKKRFSSSSLSLSLSPSLSSASLFSLSPSTHLASSAAYSCSSIPRSSSSSPLSSSSPSVSAASASRAAKSSTDSRCFVAAAAALSSGKIPRLTTEATRTDFGRRSRALGEATTAPRGRECEEELEEEEDDEEEDEEDEEEGFCFVAVFAAAAAALRGPSVAITAARLPALESLFDFDEGVDEVLVFAAAAAVASSSRAPTPPTPLLLVVLAFLRAASASRSLAAIWSLVPDASWPRAASSATRRSWCCRCFFWRGGVREVRAKGGEGRSLLSIRSIAKKDKKKNLRNSHLWELGQARFGRGEVDVV